MLLDHHFINVVRHTFRIMLRHSVMEKATRILSPATPMLLARPTGEERSDWLWRERMVTGTRLTTRLVMIMVW